MKKIVVLICFMLTTFMLVSCNNKEEEKDENVVPTITQKEPEPYVPSDTILSFSDENQSKVITEPTFNINDYTKNAGTNIKPYQFFGDGMCLQRDAVNRLWGKVAGSKNIAVELNGVVYYGTVSGKEWEVYLPKMNAGGPYNLTIIAEAGRYTIKNVYIGEVFLCAGQSNMEWQPGHAGEVLKDLYSNPDCKNDKIRMLNINYFPQLDPTNEVVNTLRWKGADQVSIPVFTAIGYLFGKQMQEELGCPIGLIATPVGGSNIEFWLSEENYNKVTDIYTPYINKDEYMQPSLGYNGMLYPLTGINMRGVVWYQGESNAFGTETYYDIALKIFIEQCREMLGNEQLTFTICELARFNERPLAYSIVNEKINLVAKEDKYVVVARNLDLGDWNDIHPKDKKEIAKRAAYETLRMFFNKEKVAPIEVASYEFNSDGSVTITLTCDAKLVNENSGFEVYVDGKYSYDCNVSISGNKLTVAADGEIKKVRYGYTCKVTEELKTDVSKSVTVFDNSGFPLDLFLIEK